MTGPGRKPNCRRGRARLAAPAHGHREDPARGSEGQKEAGWARVAFQTKGLRGVGTWALETREPATGAERGECRRAEARPRGPRQGRRAPL